MKQIKLYLTRLFKKGYSVVTNMDNINDIQLLGNPDTYLLKLKESYGAISQLKNTYLSSK